jgi:hypothetical protein
VSELPLYRRLLGADFNRLPPMVRQLHDFEGTSVWSGSADVERGSSLAARLLATSLGLPPAGRGQRLTVTFMRDGSGEIWERRYNSTVFRSHQSQRDGGLSEKVGAARLSLAPMVDETGLRLSLVGVTVAGIAVPSALLPVIVTLEHENGGRYAFDVECRYERFGIGRIVRYAGWLTPGPAADPV